MVVASFPCVPASARSDVPPTAALRRFGSATADLDVDFAGPRADVTDAVVAACTAPPVANEVASRLPISVRIRALLRLATAEAPLVELILPCPAAGCGEELELSLPLAEIAADPDTVVADVEVEGRRVRIPTGDDQRRFAAATGSDVESRLAAMRVLSGDATLDAAVLETIEAALDAADPLVGFFVTATCPGCGEALRHDVDLEALAHGQLARAQARLIESVHRLATAYHWTEHEVLALPPRRRAWYLGLIERGAR